MIQVKGLHKSFGKHKVLQGIDLQVEKGEVIVILGPSGSGKTTFLRCLNFLEPADGGEITIGSTRVDCRHVTKKKSCRFVAVQPWYFSCTTCFKIKRRWKMSWKDWQ